MAETFEALRRGPGGFEQRVCIKRILPAYADDRAFVEGFLREARTSAALRHANIVHVLDFGEADDSYYLALELIDGLDLRAVLGDSPARRVLEPDVAVLIAGELAAALEHAHAGPTPVVHRDLSPSNTLISCAGEVKLTDFGIARALDGHRLTATGVIKGKVPYLPPEYIEHGRFDQRSDLFALGVLLFELLAGERPFDGESEIDTIRRIVAAEGKSLTALAPRTPPGLVACVERLIAADPAARWASARALLEQLPVINVHQTRRKLAALVQEHMLESSAPGESSTKASPVRSDTAVAPTQAAPRPLSAPPPAGPRASGRAPAAAQVTRTSVKPRARRALSRSALVALGAAGIAFVALLLGFSLRTLRPDGSTAAAPPPLPRARALSAEPALPETSSAAAGSSEPAPAQPGTQLSGTVPPAPPPTENERPRAPAELRVVVIPFGDVWIDGKPLGHAPVSVKLPPGTHEVSVGDGRPEQQRTLSLRSGEHENAVFRRAESRR
jgi:serine/threonine protein kinase